MSPASLVQLDALSFGGDIIGPDDPRYDQFRIAWNGVFDRRPAYILRARNSQDVSAAIILAAERKLPLAVRCGGHSFPGYSTCDAGIVLDLSLMRAIRINPIERIAEVEGGALLGDLDKAANPFGLVTPAGVVSHTGVAGLTLGGGMGWLSRRFGLTIDSLLSAEICLANGEIVTTSPDEEPELFWGLRGGGGNFGVVTKFVFRLHPLGDVRIGKWEYRGSHMPTVLANYDPLAARAPRQLSTAFTALRDKVTVTAFWSGERGGAEGALSDFGKLAPDATGAVDGTTFLQLQSRNDDHFRWGRRYYAKGGFLAEIGPQVIQSIYTGVLQAPTNDSEIFVTQLGGAVCDVGENATAYSGRAAAFYWIVEAVWDDPADGAKCLDWGRKVAQRLQDLSLSTNYVNEQSDPGIALEAYGAEKYQRLVKLKSRFDPANLFRLNQNIPPSGDA